MDSWIVVAVLGVSVLTGALSGWVLLGLGTYQTRHRAIDRPAQVTFVKQGRHRAGRLRSWLDRATAPPATPAGVQIPAHARQPRHVTFRGPMHRSETR